MKRFATSLAPLLSPTALLLLSSIALLMLTMGIATAQAPVIDSSVQASPIGATTKAPTIDSSTEASPALGADATRHTTSIAPGTAIPLKLTRAIDSGRLKNGQTVAATLTASVRTTAGTTLRAGTPVEISVIATVPAGKLMAVGEFSLQVVRIGSLGTYTDTKTYRGKPGHRDVADAAPSTGTDAGLPAGAPLTFHVLKPPTAATSAPRTTTRGPGSIDGIASGSAPPSSATSKSH